MTAHPAGSSSVAILYTPIAADYGEIWAPLLRPYALRLLDRLELGNARRVLDLGCGTGRLLADIGDRAPAAYVVGCDLTEAMLRLADPRFGRAVMDATAPSFADATFDAVVSAFVLFHIPDPAAALRGARRILRPGGWIAVSVWGSGGTFPALDVWNEALNAAGVPPDPIVEPPRSDEVVNSSGKMRTLLEEAGFGDVSADEVEWTRAWTIEGFVEQRIRLGPSRRRLALLSPQQRPAALARAREEVASLPPEDLVDHDVVVLASGTAAP